jgi:SOS-response transcriptional repressor LexA
MDNADMNIGERIKETRKERGMTQVALAKAAGVHQSTIADLERGRTTKTPSAAQIARVLGVDALWLATGRGRKEASFDHLSSNGFNLDEGNVSASTVQLRGKVPVISLVAAGNWSEAVDNFAPGQAEEWVATTIPIKQHTYALRVQGDSMEPKFLDGAIIIVEPEEEARNGSYVIVRQNGSEATFKQLVIDGTQTYLKPLNSRYPIMVMQPDAIICGVVKQVVMNV